MTTIQTYRFQLPKKALKSDCPDCGPKHRKTLSRYVDMQTGEALPDIYGRCDRESNCGYHLNPYTKRVSGISYADELNGTATIPRTWFSLASKWKRAGLIQSAIATSLQTKEGATLEQAERVAEYVCKQMPAQVTAATVPIHSIPEEVFTKSLGHYGQNQFARLLKHHFGLDIADSLLQRFQIGTSTYWNKAGACVFWLIDEQGRKRGGQVKLFDEAFHTVKYVDHTGRKRTRTSWVHAALAYHDKQQQQASPEWLTAYIEQAEFAPCLFGLPQLVSAPNDQPIAIVEAPKTAVLCTPYFPQFIWLAVIGRSYLNAERLAPIKGRSIVLFPDVSKDGRDYQYWQGKANNLRQQGFSVIISDRLEHLATDATREKGYDLADYVLNEWNGYPPNWNLPSTKPAAVQSASTNQPLRDVLAQCLQLPVDAVPLYQFTNP